MTIRRLHLRHRVPAKRKPSVAHQRAKLLQIAHEAWANAVRSKMNGRKGRQ
jgi:hypothetical protein